MNKNEVMVGLCQQVNAGQVRILTEQNKEMNLIERKVLHALDQKLSPNLSRLEKVDALKSWSQRCLAKDELDLQTLWEVLDGETTPQSIHEMAQMYFSQSTDLERSRLLRALIEDRVYFERKGDDGFVARSADKVQQVLDQQAREKARLLSRAKTLAWIRDNLVAHQPSTVPGESESFLPALIDVAVRQQPSSYFNQVSQLFQEANLSGRTEELCLQLLISSGYWDQDINLQLLEYDVPQHFSRELLQSIETLDLNLEHELQHRQDLRQLYTITIDDQETTDIDDALSCERLEDGSTRLWIHIADPASFVEPETQLDTEAARRFTSIYLCEGKIEMLPARLSQELCSLVQGQPRLALTVSATLDAQGQLLDYQILESVIEVKRRMSYDEVDQEIEGDPELKHLYQLSQLFKAQRIARGAVEFSRPELRIKVDSDKQIQLKRIERNSPAQQLVSELMILANHLVAKQLGEARLPLIYKVQEAPLDFLSDGRPLLKRAEMSTRPGLHYGLGLDVYTQFTSPIRRYNDLVLHRQIKSWLRTGSGSYSEEELNYMIALSDRALNTASIIQRENFRYWLLKYFEQLPTPRHVQASINSITDEKAWLNLSQYCYDVPMAAGDFAGCKAGDELLLSIEQSQPRRGRLVLRRVKLPVSSETA